MKSNKSKICLSIFWIILGITLFVLSMMQILDSSIYSGMGGGLIGVGILQLIRNIRYLSNPEYQERIDIENNDERNHYLRMKAWSWAGYLYVIASAILILIFMILGKNDLMQFCSTSLACIVFLFWISYAVLRRKY